MRVSLFLEDVITREELNTVVKIIDSKTEVFSDLVVEVGLDKARDFRHANLGGVDFCGSDLRGFDFTGADLRGTIGLNVVWDGSTIFEGAEVQDSIFAYDISKRKLFDNPQWKSEYNRRSKDYWAKNIEWFSDRFTKDNPYRNTAIELAKAICDETKDALLRSQLLFFLVSAFDTASGHKDYLLHNVARHADDAMTVRATLRAMGSLYQNDVQVFSVMLQYVYHKNSEIRNAAMAGILNSKLLKYHLRQIGWLISDFDLKQRRKFLQRAAKIYNVQQRSISDDFGNTYDINKIVSRSDVSRAAFVQIRYEETLRKESFKIPGNTIQLAAPKADQVHERAVSIEGELLQLCQQGIPLRLNWP